MFEKVYKDLDKYYLTTVMQKDKYNLIFFKRRIYNRQTKDTTVIMLKVKVFMLLNLNFKLNFATLKLTFPNASKMYFYL